MLSILIAGGSGLIGSSITPILERRNYRVTLLSRNPGLDPNAFYWDPEQNLVDKKTFENNDVIINLAGTSIAGKRWTQSRKQEILQSRLRSTALLHQALTTYSHTVKLYINASAIGIYGDAGDALVDETAPTGLKFLSGTCRQWEAAALKISETGIRTTVLRFGHVLAPRGGMLVELLKPLRMGILPVFGSGQQYQSWIHFEDIGNIICHLIENNIPGGIYNAVAPEPVQHSVFMQQLGAKSNKSFLKVKLPAPLLHLILGEMSTLLLDSARVSSEKIRATGFKFDYTSLGMALNNLL